MNIYFKQLQISAVLIISALLQHTAFAATDPRFTLISQIQLRQAIEQTPISSPQHAIITARADVSGLQGEAYGSYTAIWAKKRHDANANLRRGIAALNYWLKVSALSQQPKDVTVQQELNLYSAARECLATSVKINPQSVDALVAYGYFSWQFDNRMAEGLGLLKKAARLNSKSARAHANLGSIYSNLSGNAYNPQEAKRELETAIQLSPNWAFPRWNLMLLHINTRQFQAAQKSLESYLSVVPASIHNDASVKEIQSAINKGLEKL